MVDEVGEDVTDAGFAPCVFSRVVTEAPKGEEQGFEAECDTDDGFLEVVGVLDEGRGGAGFCFGDFFAAGTLAVESCK